MSKIKTWQEFFNFSPIVIGEKTYELNYEDIQSLETKSNYWHRKGDPSSWLAVGLFKLIRHRYPDLTESEHLRISAHLLDIPLEKLIGSIKWHDSYLSWHDGKDYNTLENLDN